MAKHVFGPLVCLLVAGLSVGCGGGAAGDAAEHVAKLKPSEIADFARDIDQLVGGVADAQANFADDLMALAGQKPVKSRVDTLAATLASVLRGVRLASAQRDVVVNAILASGVGGDATKARDDIKAALTASGVTADAAATAAEAVAQLHSK